MTKTAEQLLEQALALEPADRAAIVDELMDTLEPSTNAEYVSRWTQEIQSRIEDHESGKVKAASWDEARTRIFGNSDPNA
jgi:putative addiction module component (TIGR02574 family)